MSDELDSVWYGRFIRLWSSGRRDLDVIAILMTESYFRSASFRILEFVCYYLLKFIGISRADTISLGIGQVQARHWTLRPTFSSINSFELAYDLVASFMPESASNLRAKVAIHVGEVRGYYMRVAEKFLGHVRAMADKANNFPVC